MAEEVRDRWARWLLERRHGGDPDVQRVMLAEISRFRDKVIEKARISEGDVLLDVGTGDGLIAFGALPLVGQGGLVIFSDISQDLLDHCRSLAQQMEALDRCKFLHASADDLLAQPAASVDVVTTRSVLIYVAAKQQAFLEFARVLRSGGRLSIAEPINRYPLPATQPLFFGYDATPIQDLTEKIGAVERRYQSPTAEPMIDFDEKDLLRYAWEAGFRELRLELHVGVISPAPIAWDVFVRKSGNPNVPTVTEVIREALTPAEAARLSEYLKPLVETGRGIEKTAMAYVAGIKRWEA